MRRRGDGRWPGLALLTGLAAAGAGLAWTVSQHTPLVAFEPCVTSDPRLTWLGIHLALLHEDPVCPTHQLALGPAPAQEAWLTIMVVVPLLATNLLSVVSAVACWAVVRTALARLGGLLGGIWRHPALPAMAVRPRRSCAAFRVVPAVAAGGAHQPILRRGPPALAVA